MSYALIKNKKLVRMSESLLDVCKSLMAQEADGVHKVDNLDELNRILNAYESGTEPAEDAEPVLTSFQQLMDYLEIGGKNIVEQASALGGTGQETIRDFVQKVKERGGETVSDLRKKAASVGEVLRAKIHEATKPTETPKQESTPAPKEPSPKPPQSPVFPAKLEDLKVNFKGPENQPHLRPLEELKGPREANLGKPQEWKSDIES
jgi:hypothetical protein